MTTNGADVLDLVDESVDVAILDRRMPGTTGDEILEDTRTVGYQFPVAMLCCRQNLPHQSFNFSPLDRIRLHGDN